MTPDQRKARIEKIRGGIQQRRELIPVTSKADRPAEEREARVSEQLDQISSALTVHVNGRGNIFVKGVRVDKFAGVTGNLSQVVALLLNLNRKELQKHLCAISDQFVNEDKAISQTKREQIIAAAKHAIFELGQEEEALIRDARENGLHILRRPDVDVRCVLGLAETMPEPHGI